MHSLENTSSNQLNLQQIPPSSFSQVQQPFERSLVNNLSTIGRACEDPNGDCFSIGFATIKVVFNLVTAPFVVLYEWLGRMFWPTASLLGVSEAAFDATQGMQINPAKLGLRPEPIALNELELSNVSIEFTELLTLFDQIFTPANSGCNASEIQRVKRYINSYIEYIAGSGLPSQIYAESIRAYAKNIIFEMQKPDTEVPTNKKITAFMEIADACQNCQPRRYEESKRQYLLLTNRTTTVEQQLLTWLQMLKDDIIIGGFQTGQFHVINHARAMPTLANKWGLDNQDRVNMEDPYRDGFCGGGFSESVADSLLDYEYIPARLVDSIKARFDCEANNDLINNYLAHENGVPDDFAIQFYEPSVLHVDQMVINAKGVAWILKKQGFLI